MPLGQIITTPELPSAWSSFASGIGEGIATGSKMMVNQKLNDMLEQRQLARQHAEWARQGEEVAKYEPDKSKREMIKNTIAAIGLDNYSKLQDRLGTQNMEALMSGAYGNQPQAGQSRMPQARQSMVESRDYAPEGLMSAVGQGMGQNQQSASVTQRQPSIQQQEMLNAQQAQAQNSQLMANSIAPNIQGIPQSQKIQQQEGPSQQQNQLSAPVANKNWARDASEEEFNAALSQVPISDRQKYRNYRLQLQKAGREERAEVREIEKEPKKYIKEINQKYESTLRKRPIFKTMEKSAGKLQSASVYRKYLSDRWGLPAGSVLNTTEQVIDKLGNQLIQGVSGSFDQARILQTEVETFIKANPSLLNTPEGMQKLAKISIALDDIAEDKWKYKNELVKSYKSQNKTLDDDIENSILEKEPEFVEKATNKIEQIMSKAGIERPELAIGNTIEKKDLSDLPIGSKIRQKSTNKIFEKTIDGMKEVTE